MRPIVISRSGVGSSSVTVLDHNRNPFNVGFGCVVTGTVSDYTIEHTFDNVMQGVTPRWFPHPSVVNQSSNQDGTYAFPIQAMRITIATGTGSVEVTLLQAGHGPGG